MHDIAFGVRCVSLGQHVLELRRKLRPANDLGDSLCAVVDRADRREVIGDGEESGIKRSRATGVGVAVATSEHHPLVATVGGYKIGYSM
jgi:hypothetical protein